MLILISVNYWPKIWNISHQSGTTLDSKKCFESCNLIFWKHIHLIKSNFCVFTYSIAIRPCTVYFSISSLWFYHILCLTYLPTPGARVFACASCLIQTMYGIGDVWYPKGAIALPVYMASYNGGGGGRAGLSGPSIAPPLTSQILVFFQPTEIQNTKYDN